MCSDRVGGLNRCKCLFCRHVASEEGVQLVTQSRVHQTHLRGGGVGRRRWVGRGGGDGTSGHVAWCIALDQPNGGIWCGLNGGGVDAFHRQTEGVVSFLIFGLVVLGGYFTAVNGIDFGRQQGYAPEQPIKFSHETHAGVQGIDCNYCHDGARRSRHSVIPAANTCMNCHRAVKTGAEYGTAEISKIFASIGYDPSTDRYIDDYASLSEDEIKAIYTKWISDQYLFSSGKTELDRRGKIEVDQQWEGIKSSLTNELKSEIPGPIEWIRIHHLPDHVTYNHSQHVTVGELECQTCHGKVEEMEVLQQYAPLSMGWCVNCHRQTEVKFQGNEYYQSYANFHEELASGEREKVTVEDIGGLECQKCHY